ncbi:ABC transporter ATP-binding protein [Mycoplasmopsis agassizii]|uniref:ABC transporter ATP-binding protein n=1 Tax=Mycoplasmopsis agassizii TaxID=33922 RepID=A0ABX4H6A1_9BACT|nr:ABC transporter ATP-binding protein [Mycoplasmopsis agassizii]PAF55414.1 ABC transporter ATP-binding protein [Mycoplasmopsis agassizii]SMC18334.1 ABC-type sugar transport system, ATPase component [Mycoplasmopsis agassizii]
MHKKDSGYNKFINKDITKLQKINFVFEEKNKDSYFTYPKNIAKTWNVDYAIINYKEVFHLGKNEVIFNKGMDLFLKTAEEFYAPWDGELFFLIENSKPFLFYKITNFLNNEYENIVIKFSNFDLAKTWKIHNLESNISSSRKIISNQKILVTSSENNFEKNVFENFSNLHIETFYANKMDNNFKNYLLNYFKNEEDFSKNKTHFNPDLLLKLNQENETFVFTEIPYHDHHLPTLKVSNLNINLDKKHILKDINFEIFKGEFISILGPSGSGKSTLLNSIASILEPTSGKINFNNVHNIGFVFQNYSLYNDLTVYKNIFLTVKSSLMWNIQWHINKIKIILQQQKNDSNIDAFNSEFKSLRNQISLITIKNFQLKIINLKLSLLLRKIIKTYRLNKKEFDLIKDIKEQVSNSAKQLEIDDLLNKKASALSGGQRQRVAIAKAISKNPDLLILDEPFSSLDYKVKILIRSWVKEIQNKLKITTLFVTHDQDDAMWLSDKVIFLKDGEVKQFSQPNDFFEKPNNLAIAKFVGNPEINYLKSDDKYDYYIRGNHIKINEDKQSQWSVLNNFTNGNYYVIEISNGKNVLEVITTKNFLKSERVSIELDKSKILIFDKQNGNLVDHEK